MFYIIFLIITSIIGCINPLELNGPFLLWGNENLQKLKSPALSEINESALISTFSEFDLTLLFQKERSLKLNNKNFPCLNQLIENNTWSFLNQHILPIDLLDYALDVEIIKLDRNNALENDEFVCKIFNDRSKIYGKGKVLGILSNLVDNNHGMKDNKLKFKRSTTTSIMKKEKLHPVVYTDKFENILLYTNSPPILTIKKDDEYLEEAPFDRIILDNFDFVETEGNIDNKNGSKFNLTVNFIHKFNQIINIRFMFKTSFGYWSLPSVEIKMDSFSSILAIIGNDIPNAPFGFSYWCGRLLTFIDEKENKLQLDYIQVEPFLQNHIDSRNHTQFNDAYDCVTFMTVPILSGIFVSFFLFCITLIGIIAIMEIKTPTKFDKDKSKQLTIILSDKDLRN